jgi:hypothetical protein
MAQKTLNEQQLRKYVENEVRNTLLNEGIDEGILSKLFDKLPGFSWESVIGAVLGHVAIAPILKKLLTAIGIPCDGKFGQFIINAVADTGMAYVGDWVDKKWNPIGRSNNPELNK